MSEVEYDVQQCDTVCPHCGADDVAFEDEEFSRRFFSCFECGQWWSAHAVPTYHYSDLQYGSLRDFISMKRIELEGAMKPPKLDTLEVLIDEPLKYPKPPTRKIKLKLTIKKRGRDDEN